MTKSSSQNTTDSNWNKVGHAYLKGIGFLNAVNQSGDNTFARIAIKSGSDAEGKQQYLKGSFFVSKKAVEEIEKLRGEVEAEDANGVAVKITVCDPSTTIYEEKVYLNGMLLNISDIRNAEDTEEESAESEAA
jgi:hypothetical protein